MSLEASTESASSPLEMTCAPAATTPPETAARSHAVKATVLQAVAILVGAAGFAWFLRQVTGTDHPHSNWVLMVLLAGVSLVAGCWGAIRRWRDYTLPLRQLQAMVPLVRDGSKPIDELSSIEGGVGPIVPMLQQLLRDLRQERARNAELQEEIRQRVQSRTESLERKIGSLQQQATRDALTGLHNRRLLDQQLPALIEQSKQTYVDLTVLMIDVDYFKTLNDTLGHAAGDQLLRQIAQLIRSSIRTTDAAFRCGGDEFVIVLPGASEDIGARLSERLRSLVDVLGKTLKVPRAPRLSIGMASLHGSNVYDPAELLALADKSLYDVKSARPGPSRAA